MYQKRSLNVIPLVLTALVIVVSFAFIVSAPVSASNAGDALFPDPGESSGQVVLDTTLEIDSADTVSHYGTMLGYTLEPGDYEGYETVLIPISSIYFNVYDYFADYLFRAAEGSNYWSLQHFVIEDASGSTFEFDIDTYYSGYAYKSMNKNVLGNPGVHGWKSSDSRYVEAYLLDYNPFDSMGISVTENSITTVYDNLYYSSYYQPVKGFSMTNAPMVVVEGNSISSPSGASLNGGYYLGFPSVEITPEYGSYQRTGRGFAGTAYLSDGTSLTVSSSGTVSTYYESATGEDVTQRIYILKDEEKAKYYLWLFRNGWGSSLILEGKASAGLPQVTITNGGRDYTSNYFVSLDMYDAFGVPFEYNLQVTAFDSLNAIKKFDYTFTSDSSSGGGDDDDKTPITPPGQIEIPDIIGGVVSTPGELPSLYLPFDFESPSLTVDFTSGFDYAFNSTWLGVSDVYRDVTAFIDGLVVKLVPDVSGVFGSIVYTIETYADSFRDMCRDMRNTYAVPFYNLVVKVSSLVPAPVWVVFDIWLFYCSARLIIYVFTCPLSDVIRRYF